MEKTPTSQVLWEQIAFAKYFEILSLKGANAMCHALCQMLE